MKKTTKLAGLAAGLLALVGVTFTSCDLGDTFGKDYFLGTWETLDYDSGKNVVPTYVPKEIDSTADSTSNYRIIWKFNGNAENLNDGGVFRQVIINYGDGSANKPSVEDIKNGTKVPSIVNYWIGKYDLKANSSYDKGKYFMHFQVNMDITAQIKSNGLKVENGKLITSDAKTVTNDKIFEIVKVLDGWKLEDFISYAYENNKGLKNLEDDTDLSSKKDTAAYEKNGINIHIKYDKAKKNLLCNDVEYFRYRLEDADLTGFTRMMVTAVSNKDNTKVIGKTYNQWQDDKTKLTDDNKVKDDCSWTGVRTRFLGKISRHPENLNNPQWLCNTEKKSNSAIFKMQDVSDMTNYDDIDAGVIEK